MRRIALIAVAVAVAAPAPAAAATVDVMVVGKTKVLRGAKHVKLKQRTVKVGGKRCRVLGATPLSVLAATQAQARLPRLRELRQAARATPSGST